MRSIGRTRNFIGIVIVACMAGLLLAQGLRLPAAAAETSCGIEAVSSLGGHIYSLAVVGTTIYAGEGSNFAIFDATDPSQITFVAHLPLPERPRQIQIIGTAAYVADGGGGLQIVDIYDAMTMSVSGFYSSPATVVALKVIGQYAYLLEKDLFEIVDVSDSNHPILAGSLPIETMDTYGLDFGLDVSNGYAYIAAGYAVQILDVLDPTHPSLSGIYPTPHGVFAYDVKVTGNLAIVVGGRTLYENAMMIINISNPTNPTWLGGYFEHMTHKLNVHLELSGSLAYVQSDEGSGLAIFDFSDPAAPALIQSYDSNYGGYDLKIVDSKIYVAAGGIYILDSSIPTSVNLLGRYSLFPYVKDVQVKSPYLYISDVNSTLNTVDISDPANPLLLGDFEPTSYGKNLVIQGNFLYLDRENYGFEIYSLTDPANPAFLGSYSQSGPFDVSGNYAYLGEMYNFEILDVSNPAAPIRVSQMLNITHWPIRALTVKDQLVYIAAGFEGENYDLESSFFIVDVSNPELPQVISHTSNILASNVDVVGNLAYVSVSPVTITNIPGGLYIFDVSDPTAPLLIGELSSMGMYPREVKVVNGLAYLADDGVKIIDVSDPAHPTLFDTYHTYGGATGIDVDGDYIYLAVPTSGLQILHRKTCPPPTDTPIETPTDTLTDTPTETPTFTPTETGTSTATASPTPTFTQTFTLTSSPTPTYSPTRTGTRTSTYTATASSTSTGTSTPTSSATPTRTRTPTSTWTSSSTRAKTFTPTQTTYWLYIPLMLDP